MASAGPPAGNEPGTVIPECGRSRLRGGCGWCRDLQRSAAQRPPTALELKPGDTLDISAADSRWRARNGYRVGRRRGAKREGSERHLEGERHGGGRAVSGLRAPATMNDEGLADVQAANPFRLPRLHPGLVRASASMREQMPGRVPRIPFAPRSPPWMRPGGPEYLGAQPACHSQCPRNAGLDRRLSLQPPV